MNSGTAPKPSLNPLTLTNAFGAAGLLCLLSGKATVDWFNAADAFHTSSYFAQISIGMMACGFLCALIATFGKKYLALLYWAGWAVGWVILLPVCMYA